MVTEFIFIKMVLDLMDNIKMIKKKDLVITIGMTPVSILAGGPKENNMALAHLLMRIRNYQNKDFGNSAPN